MIPVIWCWNCLQTNLWLLLNWNWYPWFFWNAWNAIRPSGKVVYLYSKIIFISITNRCQRPLFIWPERVTHQERKCSHNILLPKRPSCIIEKTCNVFFTKTTDGRHMVEKIFQILHYTRISSDVIYASLRYCGRMDHSSSIDTKIHLPNCMWW
jgi:hypothetical protein